MIVHSTDFKTNMGKYLDKLKEEDVYILRNGKPIGKLTSYTHLTDIDLLKENVNAYDYNFIEVSYKEFIKRYEETEERLEYIDGKVYVMSSPGHTHQKIIMHMSYRLYSFFSGMKCQAYVAPFDIHFENSDNKACVQPDIFIMCDEEKVKDEKYYGVPTLVIEVLSPASRTKDTITKLNLYWREGVSEYLLVDPEKQLIHYWFFKDKELILHSQLGVNDTFKSNVFNGLELCIIEIFA